MINTKYKYLIPALVGAMLVAMVSPAFAYSEQWVGDISTQVNNNFAVQLVSGSSYSYNFAEWDYANWYNTLKNHDSTDPTVYSGVKAFYNRIGGSGGVLYTFGQMSYDQVWSGDTYKSRVAISYEPTPTGCSLDQLHYYDSVSYVFNGGHSAGVNDPVT